MALSELSHPRMSSHWESAFPNAGGRRTGGTLGTRPLPGRCVALGQSLSLSGPFQHLDSRVGCMVTSQSAWRLTVHARECAWRSGRDRRVPGSQATCLPCLQRRGVCQAVAPFSCQRNCSPRRWRLLLRTRAGPTHCRCPGREADPQGHPPPGSSPDGKKQVNP